MTAEHVVECSFSDFRTVKGRKVAQLILEIPIEAADHALSVLGGVPRPDADRWCALVRLDKAAASGAAASRSERSDAPKEKSEGEKAVARAGILCREPEFQEWLASKTPFSVVTNINSLYGDPANRAAAMLRHMLDIDTRKELATDPKPLEAFKRLETSFQYRGRT